MIAASNATPDRAERSVRSHRTVRLAVCFAALFAVYAMGCTATPAPLPTGEAVPTYRVGAPDSLAITILPEPVMDLTATVRPDGMITIPLIGDIKADGRTIDEISKDIEVQIGRFKRGAQVSVSLVAAASTDVTVLGEVRARSSFPLVKATRIVEAIGQVGGTTEFAAEQRIRVIRPTASSSSMIMVDLKAIRRGDLSTNVLLQPGDIVYVPSTWMAKVGYAMQAVLFPFSPLLGLANSVGGNLVTP